jgi:uncharacterized RDD family membrane protein YckC
MTATTAPVPADSVPGICAGYGFPIVVRRWLAALIDIVLLAPTFFFLVLMESLLGSRIYQTTAFLWGTSWICAMLAYFLLMEHQLGWTVGKRLVGLRVVDVLGGRPSWAQALLRTALRIIEVDPILCGGLPAAAVVMLTEHRQRLGDLAANTYVLLADDLAGLQRRGAVSAPAVGG